MFFKSLLYERDLGSVFEGEKSYRHLKKIIVFEYVGVRFTPRNGRPHAFVWYDKKSRTFGRSDSMEIAAHKYDRVARILGTKLNFSEDFDLEFAQDFILPHWVPSN